MEYFFYLHGSLFCFDESLSVFYVLISKVWRCFAIHPDGYISEHLWHFDRLLTFMDCKLGFGKSAFRNVSIPEVLYNCSNSSPFYRITITSSNMIDIQSIAFRIKSWCYDDISNHNINRDKVSNSLWKSINLFYDTQSDEHKICCSCCYAVKPARKRFQVTGVYDSRPNNCHWQISPSSLDQSFTKGLSEGVGVGIVAQNLLRISH